MADSCGLKSLVARPEGGYHSNPDAGLVWLPGLKGATEVRRSHEYLANQSGRYEAVTSPGPDHPNGEVRMANCRSSEGWVYFIGTKPLERRLTAIQNGNHREWFKPDNEIIAEIDALIRAEPRDA